jgi:hypothetical protein
LIFGSGVSVRRYVAAPLHRQEGVSLASCRSENKHKLRKEKKI